MASYYMSSGPAGEPISRTEAKLHLRVDATTEDSLTDVLITAARQWVETFTGRQLITATYVLQRDSLPSRVMLPHPPLQSVSSVAYVDTAGSAQTAAATLYDVLTHRTPGEVILGYGDTWPTTRGHTNDVTITYKAGYSSIFTAATTDYLTVSGRSLVDGDLVRVWNSGGALPTGLSADTDYYIRDTTGQTCKLAATSGGVAIDLTAAGTGTHYMGDMPEPIRQAIKLLLGHLFEHRESVSEVRLDETPMAVKVLLWPYRVWQEVE